MPRIVRAIVLAAAPGLIAAFASAATPALAAPDCMTLNEARKAFPGDHLHWHGPKHCWDNVGKSRSQKPAANAKTADAAPASSASNKPADVDKPSQSAQPAAANDAPAVRGAAVPFIAEDPSRLASWSALATQPQAQQVEPSATPAPAPQVEDANVVIGAPNAAPGSPDDLLEHCCWPPTVPEQAANPALLPRMVIASAGACGLAAGLWLFVYRRRRPARGRRAQLFPSILTEDDMAMGAPPWAAPAAGRTQSAYQVSPVAMYAPRRLRNPADELERLS